MGPHSRRTKEVTTMVTRRTLHPRPPLWRVGISIGDKPVSTVTVEAEDEDTANKTALRTMHELYGRQAYRVTDTTQLTKLHLKKGNVLQ